MEELYGKMQEYLQMDTEIPFQEFTAYYNKVIEYLRSSFEKLEQEEKIKAKYIVSIVESNSAARAQRKGSEMKKYKKMQEKMAFWDSAIIYNLTKAGMSQQEIDDALRQLNQENESNK
jgi:hypothetical protein